MGKVYINENQILVSKMIEIYKPEVFDWMSYTITKKNILTFHHIDEVRNGGENSINNGALLTKKAHRVFNILCDRNYLIYEEWNELFKEINKSLQPPSEYYMDCSRTLKKETQRILYWLMAIINLFFF